MAEAPSTYDTIEDSTLYFWFPHHTTTNRDATKGKKESEHHQQRDATEGKKSHSSVIFKSGLCCSSVICWIFGLHLENSAPPSCDM